MNTKLLETLDNHTQQAYQRLQLALNKKFNEYEKETLKNINKAEDQVEREYHKRRIAFRYKQTETTTYKGYIHNESIKTYFNDLWTLNNEIEHFKINITKLNTILNLFPLYQSVSNLKEIKQDESLAEYWWKPRFLGIFEEIYELLKKKDLQGLTHSFNTTSPKTRNPFKIIGFRAYKTGITQAEYNNAIQLFKNLKDTLKKHYALKSVSNIITFIDVYYSEFKEREYVILETDEQVKQYEIAREIAINNIKIDWNLVQVKIIPAKQEDQLEIEEIEDF